MKKINRASELLWVLGVFAVALGVALCSKADLGVSMIAAPAFVLSEALSAYAPFLSVGVTEYLFEGVLLLLLCLVIRRFRPRYLLAFLVAVLYGYTLNLFLFLLSPLPPLSPPIRFVLLLVGDTVTAFGVACFFRTYLPLQVYELFVAEFARRFFLPLGKTKWGFDLSLLALSLILALSLFGFDATLGGDLLVSSYHSIGIGTLITTAINSPLISLMGRLVDRFFGKEARFSALSRLLSDRT